MQTQLITVGQRVRCALHWAGNGTIYEIHGEQTPQNIVSLAGGAVVSGGNALFDVVFDNGHVSRQVHEAIVRGIQWQILDAPLASSDAIAEALRFADAEQIREQTEKRLKTEAREADRVRLRAQSSDFLAPVSAGKYPSAALGSRNLKKELAHAFPGVKFSVTSDTFSGGDSISVHWTLGPTTNEVESISDKYQEGSFNGMEDIYETDHDNVWPELFGGAKYVHATRHFPEEMLAQIDHEISALFGETESAPDISRERWQLLERTPFPLTAKFERVESVTWREDWNSEKDGEYHHCRIVFSGEKNPERVPNFPITHKTFPEISRTRTPRMTLARALLGKLDAAIERLKSEDGPSFGILLSEEEERLETLEKRRSKVEVILRALEEKGVLHAKHQAARQRKPSIAAPVKREPIQRQSLPTSAKLASARAALAAL